MASPSAKCVHSCFRKLLAADVSGKFHIHGDLVEEDSDISEDNHRIF